MQEYKQQTNITNNPEGIKRTPQSIDPFNASDDGVSTGPLNVSDIKSPGKNVWPIAPSGYKMPIHPSGGTHSKSE
jgi:hypothetical protein